ncbi:MAG: hypothetical protein JWM93_2472 [Frankiales bacterium]|nr:hypothetical protein [Frankiales bacterium]
MIPNITCSGCDGRVADGSTLCARCTNELEKQLAELPSTVIDLEITFTRQNVSGVNVGGASAVKPLPYAEKAGDTIRRYRALTTKWVRSVAARPVQGPAHRGSCAHPSCQVVRNRPPRTDGIPEAAAFLLLNLEWIRHQEDAGTLMDTINALNKESESLIYGQSAREYAGQCDGHGLKYEPDQAPCGSPLTASYAAPTTKCRVCGAVYDVKLRREWLLAAAEHHLAHAEALGRALAILIDVEVTPSMVRNYAARGRIVAHGLDKDGHPLYRVGEVIDAVIAARQRKADDDARRLVKAKARAADRRKAG